MLKKTKSSELFKVYDSALKVLADNNEPERIIEEKQIEQYTIEALENVKSLKLKVHTHTMQHTFESIYPYLHLFINYQGWIELGADEHSNSWVRILDEGGMRLECDQDSLDESMAEAETWAKEWITKIIRRRWKR